MSPGLTQFSLRVRIAARSFCVAALVTCDGSSTDVTAKVPVATVEVAPGAWTVEIGQTVQLTATLKGEAGNELDRTVTWNSSDPAVATVDGDGLVTGVSEGSSFITAESEGVGGTATIRVIAAGSYNCAAQSQISQVDCWGLVDFYGGTGGPSWEESTGWLASNAPCSWFGVTCAEGAVSGLSLRWNKLSGQLPAELGDLQNLSILDLGGNNLTGSIPPELGNLSNLLVLDFPSNGLTGSIPPELGNLSNLRKLELSWNQLSGSLPSELGHLSNLVELHVYLNHLSGPIPPQLGSLSNLGDLILQENHLTGPIPAELGNLSNLERLALASNELSGPIPMELGNLQNLRYLLLGSNQLTGPIPAQLGNVTALLRVDLSGNQLSDLVPLPVIQLGGRIQNDHGSTSCILRPPGNESLSIPDTPEYRDADLDGDGLICGLEFTAVPLSVVAPSEDGEMGGLNG